MSKPSLPCYKTIPRSDLHLAPKNARIHSDGQIDQIAASIMEFGFLNPIIVDGQNNVVAGHGRLRAAEKLGIECVPVIEAKHLTATQRRAFALADNRIAELATWDHEILGLELQDLASENFDIELTGFDPIGIETHFDPGENGTYNDNDDEDVGAANSESKSAPITIPILIEFTFHEFQKWKKVRSDFPGQTDREIVIHLAGIV